MREVSPEIYLIAEPKLNWEEVTRYLESVGGLAWLDRVAGEADTDAALSDGEYLVEFAGRGCYRSWQPGLNKNVTRVRENSTEYLQNIVHTKHGSVFEHAQFSFVFQNVSRVFTHELVRHRAGVAISQESLRYVRLDALDLWVPEVLKDPQVLVPNRGYISDSPDGKGTDVVTFEDAMISIVERIEDLQRDAAEAFGLDEEGVPFSYKKHVTSALRRVAPMGLSTMMTWSSNVRTLRFVIEQRTEPGAEEEIRLVFDHVARLLKEGYPAFFGDFEPVPVEDSDVPQWKSGTWKV